MSIHNYSECLNINIFSDTDYSEDLFGSKLIKLYLLKVLGSLLKPPKRVFGSTS